MVLLIQRVNMASLSIDKKQIGSFDKGLIAYIGFGDEDNSIDCDWIANKLINLRIFEDVSGKMNNPLNEGGGIMLIPNFTLLGEAKKGFRPSFGKSLNYQLAEKAFLDTAALLVKECSSKKIQFVSGTFGADMKIRSENDGPVNLIINKSFV
jgi:D-tyrosyl-tRNA(Tyr) deacylase